MTNDVSPQIHLAALNDAWTRAAEGANTLRAQLVSDSANAFSLVKQGSIASVGKNSANQTYKSYGPGSITQTQVVEVISNILSVYDQLRAKITTEFLASADFDYAVPADFDFDQPVYDLMTNLFTQLSAGKSVSLPDIRDLRIPIANSAGHADPNPATNYYTQAQVDAEELADYYTQEQVDAKLDALVSNPKVYRAIFGTASDVDGSGTSLVVLENTLGGVPLESGRGGNYAFTLAGAFPVGKTFARVTSMQDEFSSATLAAVNGDNNTVTVQDSTGDNGVLTAFEIIVYP